MKANKIFGWMVWMAVSVMTVSCGGGKSDKAVGEGQEQTGISSELNIGEQGQMLGQWMIENVVESDEAYVRPSEVGEGSPAYMDFKEDGSFGIITNCNHLGGRYEINGDSIRLTDISWTELACDNMEVEERLKKVLPAVAVIDCLNDSITRLNASGASSYIVLKKASHQLK